LVSEIEGHHVLNEEPKEEEAKSSDADFIRVPVYSPL
jgi:hypothetical protein